MPIDEKRIHAFAHLLEQAGYEEAVDLIFNELLPMAKRMGTSLLDAADAYANCDEEQDTSWYQLHVALQKIDLYDLEEHDVHTPLSDEDAEDAWRKLFDPRIQGYIMSSGNPGGDMMELHGVVEKIFAIIGVGIVIKMHSAILFPQTDNDNPDDVEREFGVLFAILDGYGIDYPVFHPFLGIEGGIRYDWGISEFFVPDGSDNEYLNEYLRNGSSGTISIDPSLDI